MGLVWMSLLGGSYAISGRPTSASRSWCSFFPARLRSDWSLDNLSCLPLRHPVRVGLRYTWSSPGADERAGGLPGFFYAAVPVSTAFMFLST